MADSNKVINIETKNINKVSGVLGKNIGRMGNTVVKFDIVPEGIIVFYNSTSVPDGWNRFTSADAKMIVGAGSTYSVGDQGGYVNKTVGGTTGSGGSHVGPSDIYPGNYGGTWCDIYQTSSTTAKGSHYHTLDNLNFVVAQDRLLLIKSTKENDTFPSNTVLLSQSALSGLDNTHANNRYMTSFDSINSLSESKTLSLGAAGSHNHWSSQYCSWNGVRNYDAGKVPVKFYNGGNHSDSVSPTITDNIKKFLLSAWTKASSVIEVNPNMIAMWESLTPPDGWVLCNGSNGTPDLRDCFIKNTSSGNEGSGPVGDGTITLGGTVTHNNTHAHGTQYPDYEGRTWELYKHGTLSNSHSHGLNSSISWLPPYYALSFIMKTS